MGFLRKYRFQLVYFMVGLILSFPTLDVYASDPHKSYAYDFDYNSSSSILRVVDSPNSAFSVNLLNPSNGVVASDGTTSDGVGNDIRTIWKFTNNENSKDFQFLNHRSGAAPYTVKKEIFFYVYKNTNDWVPYGSQYGYSSLERVFTKEYLATYVADSLGSNYWKFGVEMHCHWTYFFFSFSAGAW